MCVWERESLRCLRLAWCWQYLALRGLVKRRAVIFAQFWTGYIQHMSRHHTLLTPCSPFNTLLWVLCPQTLRMFSMTSHDAAQQAVYQSVNMRRTSTCKINSKDALSIDLFYEHDPAVQMLIIQICTMYCITGAFYSRNFHPRVQIDIGFRVMSWSLD